MKVILRCPNCKMDIYETTGRIKSITTKSGTVFNIVLDNDSLENELFQDPHDPRESFLECECCGHHCWVEDCIDVNDIIGKEAE